MECTVCVNKYNKTSKKKITCNFCSYESCVSCIQTYLLASIMEPHCMSCRKEWTVLFVYENLSATFLNKTYKKHIENILLEKEKSYLPAAQIELKKRNDIQGYQAQITDLYAVMRTLAVEIRAAQQVIKNIKDGHGEAASSQRLEFVKQCPLAECRGYLSSQWKCGLCNNKICKDCMLVLDNTEEHKCDPEMAESIKEINKTSKACPTCGVNIFKISGCSQIFCTHCHTAWDWNTRRVETGIIHNPHYYEWKRQNGGLERAQGDVQCGGLIHMRELRKYSNDNALLLTFHRSLGHNEYVMRNLYDGTFDVNHGLHLRISYLKGFITEDEWKNRVQRSDKKQKKEKLLRDIFITYTTVVTDILRNIEQLGTRECIEQCTAIFKYCNEQIDILCNLFKCTMKRIEL